MPSPATTAAELQAMAQSVGFWWHSIDLGHGVVTDGHKSPDILAREMAALRLPDLTGKTVLDIGAYDGFYSFEAERRGAARVVALDHFAWSLDLPAHIAHWRACKERGVEPEPAQASPHWHPDTLPGKRGYDVAHRALGSRVETVVGDFMTMDLAPLGTFDVVFYLGVLYHMENPLESMRRLASVTKGVALIETHAIVVPGYEHLEICEFYSANQLNGDGSNWWSPNTRALEGLCRAAGFAQVDIVLGGAAVRTGQQKGWLSALRQPPKRDVTYFRAMAHARK